MVNLQLGSRTIDLSLFMLKWQSHDVLGDLLQSHSNSDVTYRLILESLRFLFEGLVPLLDEIEDINVRWWVFATRLSTTTFAEVAGILAAAIL